jgi:hypothetical protein
MGGATGIEGARPRRTILSRSFPRYRSNALSSPSVTGTTTPATVPRVAGDHGAAAAMTVASLGATSLTQTLR